MSKIKERLWAEELRKEGFSYSDISKKIGVSKATLSGWLSNLPYTPNAGVREKIFRARIASGMAKRRIKEATLSQARLLAEEDIGALSQRDVFMLGLGLYIGEGAKTNTTTGFVNSNPDTVRFAVRWFVEACGLAKENLSLRMHLYPDTDESEALSFWSQLTGVPSHQFNKSSFDTRTGKSVLNKGKLPYGTLHIRVRSKGNKLFGVLLFRRIQAWSEKVLSVKK